MSKNTYFYFSGLPRCGSTLLSEILNQNPDIAVTASSITPDLLANIFRTQNLSGLKNFPD